jgi:hypothetical protein
MSRRTVSLAHGDRSVVTDIRRPGHENDMLVSRWRDADDASQKSFLHQQTEIH